MNLWAKLIRCRNFLFQNRHFRTINYLNYGTNLFDGELVSTYLSITKYFRNYIVKENNIHDGPKRLVLLLIMQIIC
jgi:hypothetical protein